MLKRLFDLTVVLAASPVLLPAIALIGLLVAMGRTGPVLYRSRRIGRRGREFDMLKFRTMYVDGDSLLTPVMRRQLESDYKLAGDPRITPIGRWLRRTSLDELPQLVNVLKGEMSLVGPRPKMPEELHLYGDAVVTLLSALPGMTGLWQVRRASCASDETMRRLDLEYVDHGGLIFDLRILLATPWVMLARRNE